MNSFRYSTGVGGSPPSFGRSQSPPTAGSNLSRSGRELNGRNAAPLDGLEPGHAFCSSCTYFMRLLERAQLENKRKSEALQELDSRLQDVEGRFEQDAEQTDKGAGQHTHATGTQYQRPQFPMGSTSQQILDAYDEELLRKEEEHATLTKKVEIMFESLKAKDDSIAAQQRTLESLQQSNDDLVAQIQEAQISASEATNQVAMYSRVVGGREALVKTGVLSDHDAAHGALSVEHTLTALSALDAKAARLKVRERSIREAAFNILAQRIVRTRRRRHFYQWKQGCVKGRSYLRNKADHAQKMMTAWRLRRAVVRWTMETARCRTRAANVVANEAEAVRALAVSVAGEGGERARIDAEREAELEDAIANLSSVQEALAKERVKSEQWRRKAEDHEKAAVLSLSRVADAETEAAAAGDTVASVKERLGAVSTQLAETRQQLKDANEEKQALETHCEQCEDDIEGLREAAVQATALTAKCNGQNAEIDKLHVQLQSAKLAQRDHIELALERVSVSLAVRARRRVLRETMTFWRGRTARSLLADRLGTVLQIQTQRRSIGLCLRGWLHVATVARSGWLVKELENAVKASEAATDSARVWKARCESSEQQAHEQAEELMQTVGNETTASMQLQASLEARLLEEGQRLDDAHAKLATEQSLNAELTERVTQLLSERTRSKDVRVRRRIAAIAWSESRALLQYCVSVWVRVARRQRAQIHTLIKGQVAWRWRLISRYLHEWQRAVSTTVRRDVVVRYGASDSALHQVEKERQALMLELQARESEVQEVTNIATEQQTRLDLLQQEAEDTRIIVATAAKRRRRNAAKGRVARVWLARARMVMDAFSAAVVRRRHTRRLRDLVERSNKCVLSEWALRRWLSATHRAAWRACARAERAASDATDVFAKQLSELRVVTEAPRSGRTLGGVHEVAPSLRGRLADAAQLVSEVQDSFAGLVELANNALEQAEGTADVASGRADCAELLVLARAVDNRVLALQQETSALDLDAASALRQALLACRIYCEDLATAAAAAAPLSPGAVATARAIGASPSQARGALDHSMDHSAMSTSMANDLDSSLRSERSRLGQGQGGLAVSEHPGLSGGAVAPVTLAPLEAALLAVGEVFGLREEVGYLRDNAIKPLMQRAPPLVSELASVVASDRKANMGGTASAASREVTDAVRGPP